MFAESAGIEDVDLKFVRNNRIHYMQMKSGPEGFTGPALAKTITTMERLKQKDPKIATMIGFAYGKRNKLSKVRGPKLLQAEKEGRIDKVLVGREFWEFVLEDKNGYKIIIELAEKAGLRVSKNLESEVRTLEKTRQDAYKRILKQFKEKYGDGSEAIEKMIEDNM